MKHYHSIEKYNEEYFGKYVFGFDKIDGSNFVAEWSKKLSKKTRFTNGFAKFGTRTEMIKKESNPFAKGIDIFMNKYSEPLDKIFNENKLFKGIDLITVYGEFYGDSSFAGQHNWSEPHDLIIYDMFLYKKDFVKPRDFIDIFGNLHIPDLIFSGLFDKNIVNDVECNSYNLKEGLVFKGVDNNKVFMFKMKTYQWLNKVRELYGVNNNLE